MSHSLGLHPPHWEQRENATKLGHQTPEWQGANSSQGVGLRRAWPQWNLSHWPRSLLLSQHERSTCPCGPTQRDRNKEASTWGWVLRGHGKSYVKWQLTGSVRVLSFSRNCTTQYASCRRSRTSLLNAEPSVSPSPSHPPKNPFFWGLGLCPVALPTPTADRMETGLRCLGRTFSLGCFGRQ